MKVAGKKKVVLVDCGVKTNIIRCLLKPGCGSDPCSLEPMTLQGWSMTDCSSRNGPG